MNEMGKVKGTPVKADKPKAPANAKQQLKPNGVPLNVMSMFAAVSNEITNAVAKHPFFADRLCDESASEMAKNNFERFSDGVRERMKFGVDVDAVLLVMKYLNKALAAHNGNDGRAFGTAMEELAAVVFRMWALGLETLKEGGQS